MQKIMVLSVGKSIIFGLNEQINLEFFIADKLLIYRFLKKKFYLLSPKSYVISLPM